MELLRIVFKKLLKYKLLLLYLRNINSIVSKTVKKINTFKSTMLKNIINIKKYFKIDKNIYSLKKEQKAHPPL